mmetsp:Transcript_28892/g.61005  ORF Transcript_28892/g.61005 Transcript_28892/m.61005 type:complete len:502 (+) Transcript_28892:132-1637(+)|eukprot:CAMPEP_0183731090 /NCGR_PEP_ID=MMETSP0737-20130205/34389_1 /TAXON_ID=385413 /ORGANISM="Thalassiosira miniscula, Strain CCMP1093" /LENGTH=501 /DNA_ID=CAMNT_0025963737 /DNA_START=101 /DNA_END=1606 /DNA_ORIENTATION=+
MFTDVDLNDEPTQTLPVGHGEINPATTPQHPSPPESQAPPESTVRPRPASKRMTVRGKTSVHFSIKRPRRYVAKRSIAEVPHLENIEEEKEMLLGIDMTQQRDVERDSFRAPRVAIALFLLVCASGSYRGFNEFLATRRTARAAKASEVAQSEALDVAQSYLGVRDDEHREALILAGDGSAEGMFRGGNMTEPLQNVEDTPTILFDELIVAPPELSNLVDVFREQYNPLHNKLFLWHIPRSGMTTMKRVASYCLGLTLASEAGKSETVGRSVNEIRLVEGLDGLRFAAVDLSNPDGIAHAKALNVGKSDAIDVVSSPYLWESAALFDQEKKGYMVAMFRHPIERAVSLYYSMRKDEQYKNQVGSLISIEQYAKSSLVENNWMTRFLSNALSGELTPQHEAIAKEVLRTKCIVGLIRDKTETMRRLEMFFNLKAIERSNRREECKEKLLYWDWPGKNKHEPVVGGEAWNILFKQNTFDLRLYEYAEKLFEAQRKLFPETNLA